MKSCIPNVFEAPVLGRQNDGPTIVDDKYETFSSLSETQLSRVYGATDTETGSPRVLKCVWDREMKDALKLEMKILK